MVKFLLQLVLSNILVFSLQAQEGALLLSNYKESRNIEDQSWSICQNKHNLLMFANRRGIVTFDGINWDIIRMPSVPYSIKYNKYTEKVYVGCDNNYGFLDMDDKGFYKYISLSGDSSETGLISNMYFTDSTLFYYSENIICRHNLLTGKLEKRFLSDSGLSFTGMVISPKNIFINVETKGLFRVEADTLFPIVTGYLLEDEEIIFSLPYDNKQLLLGFANGSLSLFDGIKFYDYNINDDGYLKQNLLSDGISISDSLYAFSTLEGGAVVVDKKSRKVIATINYENGLPDDEVFAMEADSKGGLWLSHQFGLTRADLRIPIGNFNIYPGLRGNMINATFHNDELYVATSEGVYYLDEVKNYSEVMVRVKSIDTRPDQKVEISVTSSDQQEKEAPKSKKGLFSRIFGRKDIPDPPEIISTEPKNKEGQEKSAGSKQEKVKYVNKRVNRLKSINYIYKKVEGLNDKCKQLVSTSYGLLVATNQGLYVISDHSAKIVVKERYINFISEKSVDGNYYIACNEGYFYVNGSSGKWNATSPDTNFDQPIWSIVLDSNNNLWAGGNSVVYKITDTAEHSSDRYKKYTISKSYPEKYIVENINDTLFLMTESGLYFFNYNSDSFVKYGGEDEQSLAGFVSIYSQSGFLWYNDNDMWRFISGEKNLDGSRIYLLNIFEDIISISVTEKYVLVITGDNELYRYSRNKDFTIIPDTDIFVKSVTNQNGSYFGLSDIVFKRGDNTVYFELVAPGYLKQNSTQYQYSLENVMTGWSKWSNSTTITLMPPPGEHILKVRAKDIWGNISEPKTLNFTITAPFTKTTGFYVIVLLVVLILIVLIVRFRERQLRKEKNILEEKVKERTKEIQAQKEEITSSIEYASRIQMAMLPMDDVYKNHFSDHFILFKPRDIVSGDFYWIGEDEKHVFFTVADCTGHGVPGAFMSTLGISTLNEIITNNGVLKANTVLNLLRKKIKISLHQTGKEGEAADGMDMAFCILHKDRKTLEFAGAYNGLLIFQKGDFKEYKGDRMPIGIYYCEKDSFTNHEISISSGDAIYIFSDGMCDQFGGSKGSKYKISNLKKLLAEINMKPMAVQKDIIENEFDKWRGSLDQVDDIAVVGLRI